MTPTSRASCSWGSQEKKTAIELDAAGNPSKRFASEMGKAGGFLGSSEVYDPAISFTDADGKMLPELQFGYDGRLTPTAASNLRERLNQRDPQKVARQIRKLDTATGALLDTAANNSIKYLLNTYIPTKFPGTGPIDAVLGGTSEQFIREPAPAAFAIAANIFTSSALCTAAAGIRCPAGASISPRPTALRDGGHVIRMDLVVVDDHAALVGVPAVEQGGHLEALHRLAGEHVIRCGTGGQEIFQSL